MIYENGKIVEAIRKMVHNYEKYLGIPPEAIYLYSSEYSELLHSLDDVAVYHVHNTYEGHCKQIFGIPIVVIEDEDDEDV